MWTRTLSTTISTSPFRARGSSLAMARLSHAEPVRPDVPDTRPATHRADHEPDERARHEAADVGEERDLVARGGGAQGCHAADQLEDEPEREDDHRRHL